MSRDKKDYGLNEEDRNWVIRKKFGLLKKRRILEILEDVTDPSEKVLGAILFLARPNNLDDVISFVNLANEDEQQLLQSAQVKDERT